MFTKKVPHLSPKPELRTRVFVALAAINQQRKGWIVESDDRAIWGPKRS